MFVSIQYGSLLFPDRKELSPSLPALSPSLCQSYKKPRDNQNSHLVTISSPCCLPCAVLNRKVCLHFDHSVGSGRVIRKSDSAE